ncbi:MAG: CoA transferase [Betaproteobacteria bacterium]|nr:MAG: CoA transferase [Betaproteobacteria bacterium]
MRPLDNLKVLDFCWVVAGPMTTSYFAEYGATVVRVESRQRPDVLRTAPPSRVKGKSLNGSGYYANYNANKYALGLNLGDPRAIAIVKRMVAWADMVTENFTPGTMERLGLGYDELRKIKPDIILFSTSMLGRGGPRSKLPGFGAVLSSLSGLTAITGWPDRSPTNPYGAYTDFITPRFAVATLLAALDHRRRTGVGQHIDMSQLEVSLHFLGPLLLDRANNGREAGRTGNRHEAAAPHGAFPCRGEDCWVTITCMSDAHWLALRQALSDPPWMQSERFSTLLGRKRGEDELEALLAEATQSWEAGELVRALQAAGVPAGPVHSNKGVVEDPQLGHRGHLVYYEKAEIGRHPVQRSEFRLSRAAAAQNWPTPVIGEHTRLVCRDILGMTDAEIDPLVAQGVLEEPPVASHG